MKKSLSIICLALFLTPVYAACALDAADAICTLPPIGGETIPFFNSADIGNPTSNPPVELQPLSKEDYPEQMRNPNNSLNYNSGCQFGVCLQNPNQSRTPYNSTLGN